MPEPKSLRVGDKVRFVSLSEEWSHPGYSISLQDVAFMRKLIKRPWPSRVCQIDEYGSPWISVKIKVKGVYEQHSWAIFERTGWRHVASRKEESNACE